MAVIIETSVGQLTVDLYTDERPRCSKNFLKLCKVKYYNFSLFHSVQQNLVAQTGDPTATGRGGMSVYGMVYGEQARYFDLEVTPRIKHKKRGQLSMVNNGNGRHGSQFFVTLGQDLDYLDGEHTVFGEVAEGFEVLDKLNEAYCDDKHRPYRDIRIFHTVVIDDPFDDPEGLVIPDKSPGPTQEMLKSDRIGVDEEVDDTKGLTAEEVHEMQAQREANANAQLLEMVGDIPDVDVKPPDNVLFVCKLNPVTTDEDLEMIFSRFGPIVSCEVIKDHKTQESLQYAFVEFEKPEHCENAYFKMDNVLIDDRRIHVDFSQSVSKLRPGAFGKKKEEEKDEDQPRYVLKDQQRRDNNYDLVFEHDLAAGDTETKKAKKHKHHRHSDSDHEEDGKDKRKKKDKGPNNDRPDISSRSPHRANTDRDKESADNHDRKHREKRRQSSSSPEDRKKRERKTSSSEEHARKEKRKERSPSSEEEERWKEQRKKGTSPSSREKKTKERSPSPEKDRRKEKKKKERSLSPDQDRRKERKKKKKKERSPSSEEDRRKEMRKKERSPSPEEERRKERRKKERSPSQEEERRKDRRKKERSPSLEKDGKKKRRDRSPSPEEIRKRKKKERRSSSPEEDRRRRGKKEERREDSSRGSHRDIYSRDRR